MSVYFQNIPHLVTTQHAAETAMLQACAAKKHTLQDPYVLLNPYLIAPLTALVHFTTPTPEAPTVSVQGKEAAGTLSFTYPKGTEHFLPVLGLYGGHTNIVTITLASGASKTLHITTEALPTKVFLPTFMQTTPEYFGQNIMFVTPTSPASFAGYDYAGEVRWYCTMNFAFDVKRVRNGRLLVGTHRLLMPPYHTTGLFEMGMVGKIYNEFRVPGGYHHDQFEMEDGNLLVLTQNPPSGTVEDMCVLLDRKTGNILKSWDYKNVLPQNVGGSGSQDTHDWFHNNAVWYDKKTHSLTLSGRHQDAIINLDYDTGDLNWVIGDPEGWPQDFVRQYFFTPVGNLEHFDWQYEQHACVVLPDGDVMCFDNGHWRAKVKEKYVPAKDNFSRGVRYRLNTSKKEIEQIWQFGKERGERFFSTYICNVEYYGEGHYLVHSGGIGTYKGETCDTPPVRYVGPEEADLCLNSVTVEVKDDVVLYEMHLPANYYRAEKLPLYCQEDVLSFGKGALLGTLGETEAFLTLPDATEGGMVPAEFNIKIAHEEDRLVLKGTFEKGQLVMLLLEGAETKAYFVPTTKRPFLAMCVGTFMESDERAVEFPVSYEGLSGPFTLRLVIDDKVYTTGITVEPGVMPTA